MSKLFKLLGTKNVKEQEDRVEQLMEIASVPVMAVMLLVDPREGRLDIRVGGVDNAKLEDIKYVLRQAVDQLTAQEARLQAEQQVVAQETPPVEQTGPIPDPENSLANEEPPT